MRTGSPLEWIEETASGAEYLVLEAEGELPYGFELLFDLTHTRRKFVDFETQGELSTSGRSMSSWGRLIFENDRRVDAGEHEIELDDGSLRISRTHGDERVESSDVDADARDVGDVTRSSLREVFSVLERHTDSVNMNVEPDPRKPTRGNTETVYEVDLEGMLGGSPGNEPFGSMESTDVESGDSHTYREREDGGFEVEEFRLSVDTEDGETEVTWRTEIDGYLSFLNSVLGFRTPSSGRRGGGVSRIADARAESGFSSRLRWSFVSGGREVAADVGFTTQNSSVYLDELGDRGFPMPDETSFEATVEAHEGDLDAQIELGTESQGIPTLRQLRPSESFWLLFAPLPFHSLLERRGEY